MNTDRVRGLLRFALALAAKREGPRGVSKTYLTKLLYLADLEFALRHGGQTYTGIDWRFFHFGPWADAVSYEIDRAADDQAVTKYRVAPEDASHEWDVYWSDAWRADDEELQLDFAATTPIRRAFKAFSNLKDMLAYVYTTPPMVRAKPGDLLDFASAPKPELGDPSPSSVPPRSKTQAKKYKERVANLRDQIAIRLAKRREQQQGQQLTPPLYDEVFEAGIAALENAEATKEIEGDVEFSDDVWNSPMRKGRDDE